MPFRTAATAIRRALRADSIMRAARTARERPLARACMILFLFWPIANSFASVDPDLSPIQFKGLGLPNLPVDILPLIQVRLSIQNDGHGAFATLPPEHKFRLYPTNEVGAAPLGNGGSVILFQNAAQPSWLGENPTTLWLEGRIHGASGLLSTEVLLGDSVIGRDSVRIRTAPFLVLSNCDPAEKLFFAGGSTPIWLKFMFDVTNALNGVIECEESHFDPFPQDVAEIGWAGVSAGRRTVWSLDRQNGFAELLDANVGCFANPEAPGMGGNIEASPPTQLHPHGRIIVGDNLPEPAKAFLRAQEVQTHDGSLIELPLDWLKVGHVDEVMSIVPLQGGAGFKIFVGDLDLAVQLLLDEISDLEDLLLETPDDQSLIDRQAWLESHAAPYLSPANEASVNVVRTKLSAIRAKLTEGLGIDSQSLISAPVLYPILNVVDTHPQEAEWILPNPLNMVVLNNLSGVRRILIPDPGVDRMLFHFGSRLQQIGYSSNDLWAVDTAAPHSGFGEVHCASNVARRRTP